MRYAIVAAALIASAAAVPFNRNGGPPGWSGNRPEWSGDNSQWNGDRPQWSGDHPNSETDCEVEWVTVDPEAASSTEAIVNPVPTSSVVEVEPVDTSSAEESATRRRPHWGHGPHTGRPTHKPQPTTYQPEPTEKSSTKPPPVPPSTVIPSSTTPPAVPSTTAAPTSTKPEDSAEPTTAGSTLFPYPSPAPTQMTWDNQAVNSAAHATSYTDPATATTEAQCTPAASDYIKEALDGHNSKRADHQANPLIWDDSLSCIAQRQAETCIFDHLMYVNGGGYGQNLAGGTGTTISDSIGMWYNEASDYASYYGQANPPFVAGHFTQMIWASSTSLGCATYSCDGSVGSFTGELTVCNYYQTGNVGGYYADNVLPASGSGGW